MQQPPLLKLTSGLKWLSPPLLLIQLILFPPHDIKPIGVLVIDGFVKFEHADLVEIGQAKGD
jgi:hypothetical protein